MHFSLKASLMRRWESGSLSDSSSLRQKTLVYIVNNSNISLLFPPDTLMVITFAGVYGKLYCVYLKQNSSAALTALCCCWTLNTETLWQSRQHGLVFFHQRGNFFITNWWMSKSLKVCIMTWKLARSKPGRGRAEMQGSSVPLGRNHVSPSGGPLPSWALRIVLTFPPFTAPLPGAVGSHLCCGARGAVVYWRWRECCTFTPPHLQFLPDLRLELPTFGLQVRH